MPSNWRLVMACRLIVREKSSPPDEGVHLAEELIPRDHNRIAPRDRYGYLPGVPASPWGLARFYPTPSHAKSCRLLKSRPMWHILMYTASIQGGIRPCSDEPRCS